MKFSNQKGNLTENSGFVKFRSFCGAIPVFIKNVKRLFSPGIKCLAETTAILLVE